MIAFVTEIPENNEIYEDKSVYHVRPELKSKAERRIKYLIDECDFENSIEKILDEHRIAYDSSDIDITISVSISTRKKHVLGFRLIKKYDSINYRMISQNSSKYDLNPIMVWENGL